MFIRFHEQEMCDRAARHVPVPEFIRACGDCECSCGRVYYDHPQAVPHTWLRVLCDGRYVKL